MPAGNHWCANVYHPFIGMAYMKYPIDAVIAITYKCQAKCRMCSIWQIKEHHDIAPRVYEKLPGTLKDVNISGGEPFLRKDLEDIIRIIHGKLPRARMVVSSNGMIGRRLIPRIIEIDRIFPGIGFGFSIDGVGERHDYIRGIEGSFEAIVNLIKGIKARGIRNIRIAYTLTTENADQMIKVYELSRELGVQFTMQISHDSDFYFGTHGSTIVKEEIPALKANELKKDFEKIINNELSSYSVKRWVKAFVFYGMHLLASEGRRPFSSRPGIDYFYMDPAGSVYPSVLHDHIMGNLAENDFDAIWNSTEAGSARNICAGDNRPYWMGCMLRRAILDHKFQIGFWALEKKLLGLKL